MTTGLETPRNNFEQALGQDVRQITNNIVVSTYTASTKPPLIKFAIPLLRRKSH